MKHQAVIFDFGGVLIDWNPRYLYNKIFNGSAAEMEYFLSQVCNQEWNVNQDRGYPFHLAIAELVEKHPRYAAEIRAYDQRWEEMIAGPIQPVVSILRMLKEKGCPLYALSNWSAEKFRLVRHRFDFFDWFDTIVISGEAQLLKPDPRIFQLLLDKTGREAEQCVFVDDTPANIEVARRLGFTAIQYQSPDQLKLALSRVGLL